MMVTLNAADASRYVQKMIQDATGLPTRSPSPNLIRRYCYEGRLKVVNDPASKGTREEWRIPLESLQEVFLNA